GSPGLPGGDRGPRSRWGAPRRSPRHPVARASRGARAARGGGPGPRHGGGGRGARGRTVRGDLHHGDHHRAPRADPDRDVTARPRRRVRTRKGPATPRRAARLLLALGLALGAPTRPIAAQEQAEGAEGTVARLDVPFMAQEPLLCGGASIAMVARYW